VNMTDKGREACAEAMRRQGPWIAALAEGLSRADLAAADRVLSLVADRLDANSPRKSIYRMEQGL
ncbi:MAG TPA: hypothetical protein VFO41_11010, partial [Alphaproteobacteria bacterium]|nr:hypothetical protein [Alphaproteobacteria bacterium]